MNYENYMGGIEAANALSVHQRTLHNWDEKGLIETIRTPGNKRLYNVKKFIEDKKCKEQICTNLDVFPENIGPIIISK